MPVFEVSVLMVPRAAWQSNTIKFNWNPTIENYGYIPVTHISIFLSQKFDSSFQLCFIAYTIIIHNISI